MRDVVDCIARAGCEVAEYSWTFEGGVNVRAVSWGRLCLALGSRRLTLRSRRGVASPRAARRGEGVVPVRSVPGLRSVLGVALVLARDAGREVTLDESLGRCLTDEDAVAALELVKVEVWAEVGGVEGVADVVEPEAEAAEVDVDEGRRPAVGSVADLAFCRCLLVGGRPSASHCVR